MTDTIKGLVRVEAYGGHGFAVKNCGLCKDLYATIDALRAALTPWDGGK